MINITPYQNGIHSISLSLKYINEYNKKKDAYLLKEIILHAHHGLETLFKNFVYLINPALILRKSDEKIIKEIYQKIFVKKTPNIIDDYFTIELREAFQILKDFDLLNSINDKEFHQIKSSINDLIIIRNKIQHFGLIIEEDAIFGIIGNIIPRTIKILKYIYQQIPFTNIEKDLENFYPESKQTIEFLEAKFDKLYILVQSGQ